MTNQRSVKKTLLQILPAPGWHAVYQNAPEIALDTHVTSEHFTLPLHFLGLLEVSSADHPDIPCSTRLDEEVWAMNQRQIVGLRYHAEVDEEGNSGHDWGICDYSGNFCGLLPPDMSLEQFLEDHHCG